MKSKKILFLMPECAGYYTELCSAMGKRLKLDGYQIVFAATTPFYGNFKRVPLAEVGKVYYLNEFLNNTSATEKVALSDFHINNWSFYASFSRQSYQFGKRVGNAETLKKTKQFFQTIFNENEICLIISEGVSNSFLYQAYEQALQNGIRYLGFMAARIPYHFNIHVDIEGNQVLLNKDAPKEYLLPDAIPDYMKNSQFGGLFEKKNFLLSRSFYKEFFRFLLLQSYTSTEVGNTKTYLLRVYKIAFRRILANFYFSNFVNVYEKNISFKEEIIYVVYPLHFYPEASTSIMARYYDGNEYNVIKNIAFSLPENGVLVVKEHKSNVGNNSLNFYKRIKQLPNVILLDPHFNLKDNLEKFDAVVTLTSTVGFEALTKKIPVYVLGEVFYQKYPGSCKINSYPELFSKMNSIQKNKIISSKNETFNLYSQICFPGSFNYMNKSCLNNVNIDLLLKPVMHYLKTNDLRVHTNN